MADISKETAFEIALAYREIEAAENLLATVRDQMERSQVGDLRDRLGRPAGLQLGIPTSASGARLFELPWTIAEPVIEAHIAAQKLRISTLTEQACAEAKAVREIAHG